jgi:hypothetical protein
MGIRSAAFRSGAFLLLVLGPTAAAYAEGSTSAPSSDAQFDAQFQCPESLPDAARQQEVKDYFLWVGKAHPDWTVQKVLETRYRLLQTHHCDATLQNIRASTSQASASAPSMAAATYPPIQFAGQAFDFHDQRPISSGSALYFAPNRQDPDQASQAIIISYYNARFDDGSVVSAENIAKALVQRYKTRGGTLLLPFAVPNKSGNGKLTYFVTAYYVYPSDGNADIWFAKVEEIDGEVVGFLYKHQITGGDVETITKNINDWLRQNLKTYGSYLGALQAPPTPNGVCLRQVCNR